MKEVPKAIREDGFVYDLRDAKWKTAYGTELRRLETVSFVKDVLFDSAAKTYISKEFECAPFRKFLLMLDVDVTGTPTNIQIFVQFSPDGARWYNYVEGPFGSLMYVAAAGDKLECIPGEVIAHWMRIYVVSSGCTAANTFKLSVTAEFSG